MTSSFIKDHSLVIAKSKMILIDFFTEACCKGTELIEGWYWYEDDGERVGGPFIDEEDARLAAKNGTTWASYAK